MTNDELKRVCEIQARNNRYGVLDIRRLEVVFLCELVERQHDEAYRVAKLLDDSGECREKTLEGVAKWRMEGYDRRVIETGVSGLARLKAAEDKLRQLGEAWCDGCGAYHSDLPPVVEALHRVRDYMLAEETATNQPKETEHAQ